MTLLEGETGTGKTALARAVLEDLVSHDPRTHVFSARSYREPSVLLKTLDGLANSICAFVDLQPSDIRAFYVPYDRDALVAAIPAFERLPALPPAKTSPDAGDVLRRAGLALHDILARISRSHAVVLWIDDVQWLETEAWSVLSTLFQRGRPFGSRILLSARTEDSATTRLLAQLNACGVAPNILTLAAARPRPMPRCAPGRAACPRPLANVHAPIGPA